VSSTSTSSGTAPAKDWSGLEDVPLGPRTREPSAASPTGTQSVRPVDRGSSAGQPARPSQSERTGGRLTPASLALAVTDRWEGVVTEVGDDYFVGELTRTYGTGPDLVAEFNLDTVDDDDRMLLEPGAWFYVIVGRVRGAGNRCSTVSTLRFRRLPIWKEEELTLAKERAIKRRLLLGLDDDD
jgi:hypothetical protein